jgi:Mrp family chromosome partitioning ATPase
MAETGHLIVFANEKGGSGKSTSAVHVAVALATAGRSVAAIDLDTRQRTFGRYLENRAATIRRTGVELPMPKAETFDASRGVSTTTTSFSPSCAPRMTWSSSTRRAATIPMRSRRCSGRTRWSRRSTTASSIST